MDASGDIDLGDGSGQAIIEGITRFLRGPGTAGTLISAFILGIPASAFLGVVQIINNVTDFIALPFGAGGESLSSLILALFNAPADLVRFGADQTETALAAVFGESIAGILAFPITVGLVLVVLFMLRVYLDEEETSNILPGSGLDVWFLGEDEEAVADE